MSGPNWSRPLPQPLVIPDLMHLKTLADVRTLIEKHLPAGHREKSTWRVVAKDLKVAAEGADPAEVSISLRTALMLEGVECRPE
jgi:hypothetical protein